MLVQSPRPVPLSSFAVPNSEGHGISMLRKRRTRRSEDNNTPITSNVHPTQGHAALTLNNSQQQSLPREVASLPKPSEQVVQLLNSRGPGRQLLLLIRGSTEQGPGRSPSDPQQRQLECNLREIHASLFEVDEDLMEGNLPESVDQEAVTSCRKWLQQLQSFMLALQRNLAADFPPAASCSRAGQGEQQAAAIRDPAWQALLHTVTTEFGHVVVAMDDFSQLVQQVPQQPSTVDAPAPAQQSDRDHAVRSSTRLVCLCSRLEYRTFWAGKVGV